MSRAAIYRIPQDSTSAEQQVYIDNLVCIVFMRSQQSFIEQLDFTDIDCMM